MKNGITRRKRFDQCDRGYIGSFSMGMDTLGVMQKLPLEILCRASGATGFSIRRVGYRALVGVLFALGLSLSTAAAAARASFAVGDKVEIEASNHWVPCVVAENAPPSIMRVRCEAYPRLSRDPGLYPVDGDNPRAVRKATGATGPAAVSPAKPVPRQDTPGGGGLKLGEYACYGSGGRILAGLGFKVLPGNRFTDLDGGNAGTFSVSGDLVNFRGGHLGGQTGRALRNFNFRIGAQASCEPF